MQRAAFEISKQIYCSQTRPTLLFNALSSTMSICGSAESFFEDDSVMGCAVGDTYGSFAESTAVNLAPDSTGLSEESVTFSS